MKRRLPVTRIMMHHQQLLLMVLKLRGPRPANSAERGRRQRLLRTLTVRQLKLRMQQRLPAKTL